MYLKNTIDELTQKMAYANKLNTNVSKRGVDWHLDHCLKIIVNVCNQITKSDANSYQPSFNIVKSIILITGIIPRGKGKSPKEVNNENEIIVDELKKMLEEAKKGLINLEKASANNYFKHPLFGHMNVKTAMKFLKIHTNHHLKIMNDIIG